MKWIASITTPKKMRFEISKTLLKSLTPNEPDAYGYYLYVCEENRCTYDYLQDTLEIAIEQAKDRFGIPPNAWERVE